MFLNYYVVVMLSAVWHWVLLLLFCCRLLIIDNFIPPDDKNKILARAEFDEEEDTWTLKALAKGGYVKFCGVYITVCIAHDLENVVCRILPAGVSCWWIYMFIYLSNCFLSRVNCIFETKTVIRTVSLRKHIWPLRKYIHLSDWVRV